MPQGKHRQWGEIDMLYFCPNNQIVWQYDRHRKVHLYQNLPSYGLPRKELPQ